MKNIKIGWFASLFTAFLLVLAILSQWSILSNDAFPLRWQAMHLSIRHPESLYNGFFPIGYPLFLRVLSFVSLDVLHCAIIVQVLATFVYALLLGRSVQRTPLKPIWVVPSLAVLFHPDFLRAVLSSVPDFACALFSLGAFYLLIRDQRYGSAAGAMLGAAFLFRTHGIVLLGAVVIAGLLMKQPRKEILWRIAGSLPAIILQGVVQLVSGHGFFENAQAFNVWHTMHGADWYHLPRPFRLSFWEVIASDPLLFLRAYMSELANHSPMLVILGLYLWNKRKDRTSPLKILAASALVYLLLVSVSASARAELPILPIISLALFELVAQPLTTFWTHYRKAGYAVTLGLSVVLAVLSIRASLHAAARVERYDALQAALHVKTPADAMKIYSDDFALYFPHLHSATVRTSGGWAEIGLPEYSAVLAHIPDSTAVSLHAALVREGISTALIRIPEMNASALTALHDTTYFVEQQPREGYRIFNVR